MQTAKKAARSANWSLIEAEAYIDNLQDEVAFLETNLITAFLALEKATGDDFRSEADEDATVDSLRATIASLGLTDRLPSTEASRS